MFEPAVTEHPWPSSHEWWNTKLHLRSAIDKEQKPLMYRTVQDPTYSGYRYGACTCIPVFQGPDLVRYRYFVLQIRILRSVLENTDQDQNPHLIIVDSDQLSETNNIISYLDPDPKGSEKVWKWWQIPGTAVKLLFNTVSGADVPDTDSLFILLLRYSNNKYTMIREFMINCWSIVKYYRYNAFLLDVNNA